MRAVRTRLYVFRFLLRSGRGYVRNSLANVIKRALGREPYLDQSELVFRALARYRLGLSPRPALTSRSLPGEGAGSQVRLTMCAINFARALGFTYVHTPFGEIDRADRPMAAWVRAWEEEFNLGGGEATCSAGEVLDVARMYSALARCFGFRETLLLFNAGSAEFRRKYYLDKTRRRNPTLTVAVHVRRDDVAKTENRGRWAEWDHVRETVRQLKTVLDRRNVTHRIQLFSDGDGVEFRELEALGGELFINKDALWTMREMVEADVLVMGRGYFSYVAAIVSDGIKLFDPWGDIPPLEGWIVRDSSGRFDETEFGRALGKMNRLGPAGTA